MKRSVMVFQYTMVEGSPSDATPAMPMRSMRGMATYLGLSEGKMVVEWQDGTVETVDFSLVQFITEGTDAVAVP